MRGSVTVVMACMFRRCCGELVQALKKQIEAFLCFSVIFCCFLNGASVR